MANNTTTNKTKTPKIQSANKKENGGFEVLEDIFDF